MSTPLRGGATRSIKVNGVAVDMPELFEDCADGKFALGVRPENVSFADASLLRGGSVIGAEYLGTTQIVTVITANGQLKARLPSGKAVRVGEQVGLALAAGQESRCSTPEADRRCPRRFMREDTMAEVALVEVSKATAPSRRSVTFRSPSRTVNLSCCSVQPAPERPRRCV